MAKSITLLLIKVGLLTLSLDSQAKWEDWSDSNKILFKQYVLGSTLDYMQSKRMLKNPQYIEGNPFFGDSPSQDRLILQKTAAIGGLYFAMDSLSKENKRKGLLVANGIQWGVVIHNEKIGATFRYRW